MLSECNFALAKLKHVQVVQLKSALVSPTALVFESLMQLGPFVQWTMDCKLSRHAEDCQGSNQDSWSAILDIGLSDNSVETHAMHMQSGNLVSSAAYYHLHCRHFCRNSPCTSYCMHALGMLWTLQYCSCFCRWHAAQGGAGAQTTPCCTQCLFCRQVSCALLVPCTAMQSCLHPDSVPQQDRKSVP